MLDQFLDLNNDKHKRVYEVSKEVLKDVLLFNPVIVGTFPIDIDVDGSDIDVIISHHDLKLMKEHLMQFSLYKDFKIKESDRLVCSFKAHDYEFEIYVTDEAIETFNSYRHLIIERDLLLHFGQDFKYEIIELKSKGIKTEPAFALLLGLFGNPYDALLLLEGRDFSDLSWFNPLKDLPFYSSHDFLYLNKGWSFDLKFRAGEYLIRVSSLKQIDVKRFIYAEMDRLSEIIRCSKPVHFIEKKVCVQVFQWLEGEDLEFCMDDYDIKTQYDLGRQAGHILSQIQSQQEHFDWHHKYKTKIDRVINSFQSCGIRMPGEEGVLAFIEANHLVLKNRPISFQHGDYHVGNMLVKDGKIGIIDFNRSSLGDPWEEYDRIAFSYRISPYFALGQIHAYFNDEVPEEFFRVLAVYSAVNALAGIPWAIPFGPEDVQVMKDNYTMIYDNYDGFKSVIPKWYSHTNEIIKKW